MLNDPIKQNHWNTYSNSLYYQQLDLIPSKMYRFLQRHCTIFVNYVPLFWIYPQSWDRKLIYNYPCMRPVCHCSINLLIGGRGAWCVKVWQWDTGHQEESLEGTSRAHPLIIRMNFSAECPDVRFKAPLQNRRKDSYRFSLMPTNNAELVASNPRTIERHKSICCQGPKELSLAHPLLGPFIHWHSNGPLAERVLTSNYSSKHYVDSR